MDEKQLDAIATYAEPASSLPEMGMRLAKFSNGAANKIGGAAALVASGVAEGAQYCATREHLKKEAGCENLEQYGAGYIGPDASLDPNDPVNVSLSRLKENAGIGIGKGVLTAAAGLGLATFLTGSVTLPIIGPLAGVAGGIVVAIASIPVCMAVSWCYDKVVGRSNKQDPLNVAMTMKHMRQQGEQVPEEIVFAAMATAVPSNSELGKELAQRLKAVVGTHKFHKVVAENPDALKLLDQDPELNNKLAKHFGGLEDTQFVARMTQAYNNHSIQHTRAFLYPKSGELANAQAMDLLQRQNATMEQIIKNPVVPNVPNLAQQTAAAQRPSV